MSREYLIEILRRQRQQQNRKKTAVLPSRRYEPLGRRRFLGNKKYLNVYDLGQFAGGSDIDFFNEAEAGIILFDDERVQIELNNDHTAYNTYLLASDYNNWPTVYENITAHLSDYTLSIDQTSDYVTDKGLLLADGVNSVSFTRTGSPYFGRNLVLYTTGSKITATPDYAASSVSMVLDKSADIFLTPTIYNFNGEAYSDNTFVFIPPPFTYYATHNLLKTCPRSTVGDSNWQDIWAARGSAPSWSSARRDVFYDFETANLLDMYVVDSTGVTGDIPPNGSVSSTSAAGWPRIASGMFSSVLSMGRTFIPDGTLIAAIRKHISRTEYEWYFVWNTTFTENFSSDVFQQISV